MRILFVLMIALFSTATFSKAINVQEFNKLSRMQQIAILKEYKKFVSQFKTYDLAQKTSFFSLPLIQNAFAAGDFNCFYAGWPSETRKITRNGKKRTVCTSPANTNPNYTRIASSNSCKSNQMACNPVLFGSGLCVSTATQSLRNRAFAQCEQKFAASGNDLGQIVEEISSGDLAAEAEDMFALVDSVCTDGFQSSKGMCSNLRDRVAQIREAIPETIVQPEAPSARAEGEEREAPVTEVAAENKIEVTQKGQLVSSPQERSTLIEVAKNADVISDAVQHTHSPECEDEHGAQKPVIVLPDFQEPAAPESLAKVSCEKPQPIVAERSNQELEKILRENNVVITTAPISNPNLLWDFVGQLQRFPASLRRELVDAGAKIHVFEDNALKGGVTADPTWVSTSNVELKDNRDWSTIPGSGGFVPNGYAAVPTRIVLNKLYHGHGAANLFLHEHAHTLNTRFGHDKPLHNSSEFQALKNQPKWTAFMQQLCRGEGGDNDYCLNDSEEAFAELFTYYHACDASRAHLEKHLPEAAAYFRDFTSVNAKRP